MERVLEIVRRATFGTGHDVSGERDRALIAIGIVAAYADMALAKGNEEEAKELLTKILAMAQKL